MAVLLSPCPEPATRRECHTFVQPQHQDNLVPFQLRAATFLSPMPSAFASIEGPGLVTSSWQFPTSFASSPALQINEMRAPVFASALFSAEPQNAFFGCGSLEPACPFASPLVANPTDSLLHNSSPFPISSSASSFGDAPPSPSMQLFRKRKRRIKEHMTDEGEREQVKAVSKRMRRMKPFAPSSAPFADIANQGTGGKGYESAVSIQVKTLSGKMMSLSVHPDETIQGLKEYLEEKSGVPAMQQRLIYRGKQVADAKTLADYNVETGSVFHLVLALRGGGGRRDQEGG